jgi:hypothetical protein
LFAFGRAPFLGSPVRRGLRSPIVGIARSGRGQGYVMVTARGRVFAFGDAMHYGSLRTTPAGRIVGIARITSGYWLADTEGNVYRFGAASRTSSKGSQTALYGPVSAIAPSARGGYWLITRDGGVYSVTHDGDFIVDQHRDGSRYDMIAADIFRRINTERRARGLRELEYDGKLASLALDWSRNMANQGRFYHRDLSALFRSSEWSSRYSSLRENIYWGDAPWDVSGQAHWYLMNSDHHRAAILDPNLTSLGVGIVCAGGRLWVTENFGTWAGRPRPIDVVPPLNPIAAGDRGGISC